MAEVAPLERELSASGGPATGSGSRALPAKSIRTSYRALTDALEALHEEVGLLHLLWYQNATQFRSAKWWQSIDGVRRCGVRATGFHRVSGKAKRSRAERDPGSRKTQPLALKCLLNLNELWSEMCGDATAGEMLQSRTSLTEVPATLPKSAAAPSAIPAATTLHSSAFSLLELSDLLQELRIRAHSAWEILSAHLRTPPAPTFAPLVMVLLGVTARVDTLASEALWGISAASSDETPSATATLVSVIEVPPAPLKRATTGIAGLYEVLVTHLQHSAGSSSHEDGDADMAPSDETNPRSRKGRGHHRRPGPFSLSRSGAQATTNLAYPARLPERIVDRVIKNHRERPGDNSKARRKKRRAEERHRVTQLERAAQQRTSTVQTIARPRSPSPDAPAVSSLMDSRQTMNDNDEDVRQARPTKKRKRKKGVLQSDPVEAESHDRQGAANPSLARSLFTAPLAFGLGDDDVGEAVER